MDLRFSYRRFWAVCALVALYMALWLLSATAGVRDIRADMCLAGHEVHCSTPCPCIIVAQHESRGDSAVLRICPGSRRFDSRYTYLWEFGLERCLHQHEVPPR